MSSPWELRFTLANATIDRMFDRAEIILFEGKSYRLKGRIELPDSKMPPAKKKKELP